MWLNWLNLIKIVIEIVSIYAGYREPIWINEIQPLNINILS